jgi:predicted nucleic acid-binding protein
MPVLLDTMVVIHAIRPPTAKDPAKWVEARQRSQVVIAKENDFRLSAVSVLEIERGLRPGEQGPWAKLVAGINVLSVTGAIALHAGELLRKKQGQSSTCIKCLNAKDSHVCAKCNSLVSVQRNLHDALIAATADLHESIDTLYSADGGVLAFADFVAGARIIGLPNADGPLFENLSKSPTAKGTAERDPSDPAGPKSPAPKRSKPEPP